ncbi:MAG: orotidine-5'-phosphate decarboxylase [Candidatus Saccharimonadales bacterium]
MAENVYREAIEKPSDRVIVALDGMNWATATEVMGEVGQYVGMAKANALAQKPGWEATVQRFADLGAFTMADAKYKDIPFTMENHLTEVAECAPTLITIHADNTLEAIQAAVVGRNKGKDNLVSPFHRACKDRLGGILGVTVLTSYSEDDALSIYGDSPEDKVVQFAYTSLEAGIDGIVCSPKELKAIRKIPQLDNLITVVPGITPAWTKKPDDQKRISTPTEAIQDGADFLVIGRAITKPPEGISRGEAAYRIAEEIWEAL